MPAPYGVLATGFSAKTLTEIRSELEAAFRTTFGSGIETHPASFYGQIIGIMAERLAEGWDLAEAVWSAFDPDTASGASLDALAALTGTLREPARKSRATLTLTGTAGTAVPAGRVVSVVGTGTRFATLTDVVLASNGTATVDAESEEYGPFVANAGTLTEIQTPVAGWDAVTNAVDAIPGAFLESDPALRRRREEELQAAGNAALEAMRSEVLNVLNVRTATVFENTQSVVNADGMPPHSVEVMVQGGDDAEIRAAVFRSKAGGIETHGAVVGTVTDATGKAHTIRFSRPAELLIHVGAGLTVNPELYPVDGDAQVRDAIVSVGQALRAGQNVAPSQLVAAAHRVPGVLEVTRLRVGLTAGEVADATPGFSASIPVTLRQIAVFDTGRTTVTSAPGEE